MKLVLRIVMKWKPALGSFGFLAYISLEREAAGKEEERAEWFFQG